MPQTPDRFHGESLNQEGIVFEPTGSNPTRLAEIVYVSGTGFKFYDEDHVKDLGDVTSASHERLQQFVHWLNAPGRGYTDSPFMEAVGVPFESRITWWSDSSKTKKLFQTEITRSGILPTTQNYKLFSSDGVTLVNPSGSMRDVMFYQGTFEVARSRSFV